MKVRIRPKLPKPSAPPADDFLPTPDTQPARPGLSRRGRPRLGNPVPATQRAATSRRKRVEAGARRIELMLAPEVAASLDALAEHFDESRAEVVARLITRTSKRALK